MNETVELTAEDNANIDRICIAICSKDADAIREAIDTKMTDEGVQMFLRLSDNTPEELRKVFIDTIRLGMAAKVKRVVTNIEEIYSAVQSKDITIVKKLSYFRHSTDDNLREFLAAAENKTREELKTGLEKVEDGVQSMFWGWLLPSFRNGLQKQLNDSTDIPQEVM